MQLIVLLFSNLFTFYELADSQELGTHCYYSGWKDLVARVLGAALTQRLDALRLLGDSDHGHAATDQRNTAHQLVVVPRR